MKKGGGKAKGSNWERECCRTLSMWISKGERDDLLWREATRRRGSTVSQSGDIMSIDPLGEKLIDKFAVECKAYANVHLESLIFGTPVKGSIIDFWSQVNRDAKRSGRKPMLIAKQNSRPVLVGLPVKYPCKCDVIGIFPKYNLKLCLYRDILKMNFEDFI